MTVRDLWVGGARLAVTGAGYNSDGQVLPVDGQFSKDDLAGLLRAAGLCNYSRLLPPNGESTRWSILGDPTEAALKVVARKAGIDLEFEEQLLPRWREFPFDSRRKRMSTVHTKSGSVSEVIVFTKGAPREVLELCTHIQQNGNELCLDANRRAEILIVRVFAHII